MMQVLMWMNDLDKNPRAEIKWALFGKNDELHNIPCS